jgi:putative copper export protein
MDGHVTHVAVRMVHVLAATILVGGSLGMAVAGWATAGQERRSALIDAAARYEVAFWLAFAAIVSTGIGNLGAFGAGLPGPETDWGRTFSLKLALVFVLLLFSAVRVLAVVRLRDLGATYRSEILARWYAVSALLSAVIVAAAVWLAHG